MSTSINLRRGAGCVAGVALLVAMSGCNAGGSAKLGAGEDVDLCDGVVILNGLPEPDIADRQAILDYTDGALRVLDRIDAERGVHSLTDKKISVPETVGNALKVEKTAYQSLRTQVSSATTATKLHEVVQGFATSATFAGADSTVELWTGNECG